MKREMNQSLGIDLLSHRNLSHQFHLSTEMAAIRLQEKLALLVIYQLTAIMLLVPILFVLRRRF